MMINDSKPSAVKALTSNLRVWHAHLVIVVAIVLALGIVSSEVRGQRQPQLSLSQIEDVIRIGTPDTAIAVEIQRRGLDFVPTKSSLEELRRLGAGPQTIQAVDELRPMLDEAKQAIPGILTQIYKALDQGNWDQARPFLSPELASNTDKLDKTCKPFTYRAHYIEAIIERPGRHFQVRTRVLFKPLDEHAYVLLFGASQGSFVLEDVSDPPPDWFGPELSAASELTRRFIYAIKAGRRDVLALSVTPNIDISRFTTDPCWQLLLQDVNQVQIAQANVGSYKGLKADVRADVPGTFQVDQIDGNYKIVSAFAGIENSIFSFTDPEGRCRDIRQHFQAAEDPNLEAYTLKRFGIAATSASSNNPGGSSNLTPVSTAPAPEGRSNSCGDYESCFNGGMSDLRAFRWDESLSKFQEASRLSPTKGDAWQGIGAVYFEKSRYDDADTMWDKAIQLGSTLIVPVCRERVLGCEIGSLRVNIAEVSFVNLRGQKVFSAPVQELVSQGAQLFGLRGNSAYLSVRASGKNYNFFFVPPNIPCTMAVDAECPEPGFTQQKVFANYAHSLLTRVSNGQLK